MHRGLQKDERMVQGDGQQLSAPPLHMIMALEASTVFRRPGRPAVSTPPIPRATRRLTFASGKNSGWMPFLAIMVTRAPALGACERE